MREILFRGQTKDGKWVHGDFSHPCNIVYTTIGYDKILKRDNVELYNDDKVIPETVGQFIGLTDKKGKKVFEGDIVKATFLINDYSRDRVQQQKGIYKIEYHTKHCYFYLAKKGNNLLFDGNWSYYLKEIEVIGNIHDNFDLLKEVH